jgi:hypothetical protein
MRKFFYGLGVVTAVLIVAAGIGFYFLASNGAALDTASKTYTEESVVAIAGNWDADQLWKRASPRLRKAATQQQISDLLAAAKDALGPMLEYRGSKGQALMSVVNAHSVVSAQYVASGSFQKGAADFRINLVKQNETWMIEGFHIDSPAMMKRLVGVRS